MRTVKSIVPRYMRTMKNILTVDTEHRHNSQHIQYLYKATSPLNATSHEDPSIRFRPERLPFRFLYCIRLCYHADLFSDSRQ
jgi:hypothetical protein